MQASSPDGRLSPMIAAGIVLGLAMSGSLDGILLHQVLQWHHMLTSAQDAGAANDIALNTFADGLFHAATWVLTLVGLALLSRAWSLPYAAKSARLLIGSLLMGAGLFDVAEGLVNHHVLGIHHVHPTGALAWDLSFLAVGAALTLVGWILVRSSDAYAARHRKPRGARQARGV